MNSHRYWFSRGVFTVGQAFCALAAVICIGILIAGLFTKSQPIPLRGEPLSRERYASIAEEEARLQSSRDFPREGIYILLIAVSGWASLAVFIAILDASSHVQGLTNNLPPDRRATPKATPALHVSPTDRTPPYGSPTARAPQRPLPPTVLVDLDAQDAAMAAKIAGKA